MKIARSRHEPPSQDHFSQAEELVDADERGSGKKCQNVRETFPKADYFVDAKGDLPKQIERFVSLVFGKPFLGPTHDEYGMFVARASALRSVDLSRQVGAAIFDRQHRIVSTGCNEVPYPGGGTYAFPHQAIGDNRDHTKRVDPNFIEIQRSLIELIKIMQDAKLVDTSRGNPAEVADELLVGQHKELMANARVRNLVEFGRVVHAEMHAICEAGMRGGGTENATLYCTTFPCHGCARHIIAAGLAEVVYIEPYPKSLAVQLYENELAFQHVGTDLKPRADKKVVFRPFHGIAPTLYQRVFNHRASKDDRGTIPEWDPLKARPVGAIHSVERPDIELVASNSVAEMIEKVRVNGSTLTEGADGE